MTSKISQNTLIPVGVAVLVIGSATAWMTKQDIQSRVNASEISEVKSQFSGIEILLREISRRLGTIEGELKRIRK